MTKNMGVGKRCLFLLDNNLKKPGWNLSNIEKAFRELRERWFYNHLCSYAHEREWEDEERSKRREENNKSTKKMFDLQTEDIIAGSTELCIAPTCSNDLY